MKLLLITLVAFVAVASARYYDLSQLNQISSRVEVVPENVRCFRQEVRKLRQKYPEHEEWFSEANRDLIEISKEARKCQGDPECLAAVRESAKESWAQVEAELNKTEGGRVVLAELEAAAARCNNPTPKSIEAIEEIDPTPEYVACFRQKVRKIRSEYPQHDEWFGDANRALIDISRALRKCDGDDECLAQAKQEAKTTWAGLEQELVAAGGQEVLDRLKQAYTECTQESTLASLLISDETEPTDERLNCIREGIHGVHEKYPEFHDWFEELSYAHQEARRRADMCESREDKECWDAVREFAAAEWDVLKYQLEHREGGSEVLAELENAIQKCIAPAPEETQPEATLLTYARADEPSNAQRIECIRREVRRIRNSYPEHDDWFQAVNEANAEVAKRGRKCQPDDEECWRAVAEFAHSGWTELRADLLTRDGGEDVLREVETGIASCVNPQPEPEFLRDWTPSSVRCFVDDIYRIGREHPEYDALMPTVEYFAREVYKRIQDCEKDDTRCYQDVRYWAILEWDRVRKDLASRPGGDKLVQEVENAMKVCLDQSFDF